MKVLNLALIGLLCVLLVAVPAAAEAHGGFGAGAFLGLGLGLFAGLALAPAPVYVAPPVYYPSPPMIYRYDPPSYGSAAAPPPPGVYDRSSNSNVSRSDVSSTGQSRCREWRMINRHWENRWDSYYGRWRAVLVEKWGWAPVPCN